MYWWLYLHEITDGRLSFVHCCGCLLWIFVVDVLFCVYEEEDVDAEVWSLMRTEDGFVGDEESCDCVERM